MIRGWMQLKLDGIANPHMYFQHQLGRVCLGGPALASQGGSHGDSHDSFMRSQT